MKITDQHKFKRTKTALAVGVALFAVSELGLATYEARIFEGTADTAEAGDDPVTIDVLANDNDGAVNAATLAIGTQPTQGTVAVSGGQLIYTPNDGFSDTDTFTYTVQESEWRNDASGAPIVTPYTMAVDATDPIASSYQATDGNGNPITVSIFPGTNTAPGFWNQTPLGDGVVGKSWKPSTSVAQLQGCNAGDDAATPITLTMTWAGERPAVNGSVGSNQLTVTTDAAPTPVKTDGDGIVLQVFQNSANNVTSSSNGAGSISDIAGTANNGFDTWKFTTTSTWSNLSAAEFEAMPITILASTYNSKTWFSSSSSFEASVDYSTCQLKTATVGVTITAKESSSGGGGGGGSMDKVAMFALGLFGLNALRRRRQA